MVYLQLETEFYTSSFFWDVKQGRLVVTDVSGQSFRPKFKGQAVVSLDCLTSEKGTIICSETSVTTNLLCVISQKSEAFFCTSADA